MDRRLELKRLLIYLAFAFGLTWSYFLLFIAGGFKWDSDSSKAQIVGLGMLFPFIANIITRYVTKEGFAMTGKDSLMLGISFKNKKWLFFVFAAFIPWVYGEINNLICIMLVPDAFDADYYKNYEISKEIAIIFPLVTIVSQSLISFAALGEEGGWRGYMMPKLRNLLGYKRAILIGGIIWGLWHAPLTCVGHNFGTDYPGFPYVGILMMCLMCIFIGMILTFVTDRTGSIWPAAILHAVNNGSPAILKFFINEDVFNTNISNPMIYWWCALIPIAAIGIICFVIACKK